MPQQLPFTSDRAFYEFSADLGGSRFVFAVRWNGRDEAWYFDLLDDERTAIRHGIKIVLGTSLGGRSADPNRPAGLLMAHDLSGEGRDATDADLGTRVIVVFYSDEEIAAA